MTPRQTAERPDRAGQPRHLQGGQTAKHRLLSEDTDRVRHRRKDGEHDPEQVGVTGATRRRPDQHCSGERDGGTDQQPARKALAQHDAGQQSNQDRADVDQHGCRPGVEVLLGRIECDVVDGEPGHAAHAQQTHSRRLGATHRRRASNSAPSAAEPSASRPRASAPGEKDSPAQRITTKAEAQARTVVVTAARTATSRAVAGGVTVVVLTVGA